jgi:hypothetical protein
MTITTPRPGKTGPPAQSSAAQSSVPQWTAVQSGLWVCKVNGEFAGMIEARWGEGFVATTRLARTLGIFETVADAQASFSES